MGAGIPARGTTFKIGSTVAGITGISIDGVEIDDIDTTDLADAVDTATGGGMNPGEITLQLNVSAAQVDALFPEAFATPTAMEIEYPDPLGKFTFNGFVKSWNASAEKQGAVTGTAVVRVSGALTHVDPE